MTFTELNEQHRKFWAQQQMLMERRLANPAILKAAKEAMDSEWVRAVPLRHRVSLEKAPETAERFKALFASRLATSGGQAAKADPLTKLIEKIVRAEPRISCKTLLERLRDEAGGGIIIDEIVEDEIHYRDEGGGRRPTKSYRAPISGLKNRLTRARQKVAKPRSR